MLYTRFNAGILGPQQAEALNEMMRILQRLAPNNIRVAAPLGLTDSTDGINIYLDESALQDDTGITVTDGTEDNTDPDCTSLTLLGGTLVLGSDSATGELTGDDTFTASGGGGFSYTVTDGVHSDTASIGTHYIGATVASGAGIANDSVTINYPGQSASPNHSVQTSNGSGGFVGSGSFTYNGAEVKVIGPHVTVNINDDTGTNWYGIEMEGTADGNYAVIGYHAGGGVIAAIRTIDSANNVALLSDGTYAFNALVGPINCQGGYYTGGVAGVFSAITASGDTISGGIITAVGAGPAATAVSFASAHGTSPATVAAALDAIWTSLNTLGQPPW